MKKCHAIRFFAGCALCILGSSAFAQTRYNKDSLISSRIAELKAFWKKYNDLPASGFRYETYAVIPEIFSVKAADTLSYIEFQNKVSDARLKLLRQDVGLDLNANYLENFDPAIADDNLVYKRRFQAGVDWNILSDGYLSSRYKQRILKNEKVINSLSPGLRMNGNNFITISHKIIYSFNVHKIKLLEKRQQIISDKMAIANELYLLKHLPRADLLAIMQQQVDVNSMNQIYRSYNEELKFQLNESALPTNILPLFDIDVKKIFAYTNAPVSDSILKLKIENISLQHKTLDDIRLNTQFRYNYYDISNNTVSNRNFLSAGLGLSVPIPLGIKTHKNVVEAESKLLAFEQRQAAQTEHTDLLNYFYEFRYKLKQYANFFEKKKKYEELIRVERVKEKFEDLEFNPLAALDLLDELLSVEIEMLDVQQQLYLQLLDIHAKMPGSDVASFVLPFKVDTITIKPEKKDRSMYVWSEAQTKYDATYIEEYLRLNKITTAIISLKRDGSNKKEAIALFTKLGAGGIRSEVLVGSNKLLTDKDPLFYYDSVLSGIDPKQISALHLDVEPHTFPDWQTNKENYLKQYVELLKKTKIYASAKGLKLSVSIPVFFPEDVLREIYTQSDEVYLMAYEHKEADFIIRKVKEEFEINAGKTVVALRAKDFKNRPECEKLLTELSEILNTSKFALHDLETFVKLDELSVNQEK